MRHLFLVNPAAGKADCTARVKTAAEKLARTLAEPYEIKISEKQGDITRYAGEAGASGEEIRLYACGGDGTLNETISGARGYSNLAVTSIPCGSGNDYIKEFSDSSLFFDLQNFAETEERTVDLMDVNGRCCGGICSTGFDARIGHGMTAFRRMPLLGGSRAYTASIVTNLVRGVVKPFRIEFDDGTAVEESLTLCCICNTGWYGGGYNPVPETSITDGLLDVLVVKKVSRLTVAKVISAYQKGEYAKFPDLIIHKQVKSLRIKSPEEEPVNLDGELLLTDDFTVTVQPAALRFFAPKGAW